MAEQILHSTVRSVNEPHAETDALPPTAPAPEPEPPPPELPAITGVTPSELVVTGAVEQEVLIINGANFSSACIVNLGDIDLVTTYDETSGDLGATVEMLDFPDAGTFDLIVRDANGTSDPWQFEFTAA